MTELVIPCSCGATTSDIEKNRPDWAIIAAHEATLVDNGEVVKDALINLALYGPLTIPAGKSFWIVLNTDDVIDRPSTMKSIIAVECTFTDIIKIKDKQAEVQVRVLRVVPVNQTLCKDQAASSDFFLDDFARSSLQQEKDRHEASSDNLRFLLTSHQGDLGVEVLYVDDENNPIGLMRVDWGHHGGYAYIGCKDLSKKEHAFLKKLK